MRIPGELIPIVLFTMIPITAIGVPIARAIARRIEGGVRGAWPPAALPNDVGARLERMEQAIDAIAVEVERIAEGQRFTSKLLASRADVARPEGALARTTD
ncbi:MAG TPA: hypothetical protein VL308_23555 [Gemmatimonadaceae bacterium]|nr:hypothetical protein [Gemmatimonadaceae bacterium]